MNTENNSGNPAQRETNIPENDPSKAMDSKKEVEQSNDPKTDQDFPGYPHYPAKEDVMDQRSGEHRVDEDMERMSDSHNSTGVSQRFITGQESKKARPDRMPGEKNSGTQGGT